MYNLNRILRKKYGESDEYFIIHHFTDLYKYERKIKYPRIYGILKGTLKKYDCGIDYDLLVNELKEHEKQTSCGYSDGEICEINNYLSLLVLKRLASIKPGGEIKEKLISTLFFIRKYDFGKLYKEFSSVERLLSKHDIYNKSDEETKRVYRLYLGKIQKKKNIDNIDAERTVKCTFEVENRSVFEKIYFPLAGLFFLILFALLCVCSYFDPLLIILSVIPIWESGKFIAEYIISRIAKPLPLAKYQLEQIPDNAKTLTVVTTLLSENNGDLYENLERMYHNNGGKNMRIGVLADLRDSKGEKEDKDAGIIEDAVNKIDQLNQKYGGYFCFFLRRRVYSKTEGVYGGRERKRGAVEELIGLIHGEGGTFEKVICDDSFLHDVSYLITLDSDTRMEPYSSNKMVGAMLHPANLSYGIIQPKISLTLKSLSKSRFSSMYCGIGGTNMYTRSSFEIYQSVFNGGNFCGKGIIDVKKYMKSLYGKLPEGRVLSHDLLEGEIVNTAYASEISFSDNFPHDIIAYYKRLHRWIRGDFLSMFFANKKYLSRKISRYKIIENIRREIVPVFAFFIVLYNSFSPSIASLIAFLWLAAPFLISIPKALRESGRRVFSKVYTPFWNSLFVMIYELSLLPYTAYITLDAICKAAYRRLITKKKILEWTTASEAEKIKSNLGKYCLKMLVQFVFGAVILFTGRNIIGVLWVMAPFAAYLLSKPYAVKKKAPKDIKLLRVYSKSMWRFYSENVNKYDSYLPPDNIQYSPYEETAHRTSPTNIGLYMLSCGAADIFGFINEDELYLRLERAFNSLDKCKKWNGHLYNWYDTRSLKIIGQRYVSTVDSGNFVACLLALKNLLSKKENERAGRICEKCSQYIEAADFSALYNKESKLLYIGHDTENKISGDNCYDIFMSEVRTTEYFAIATKQIEYESYMRQSRKPVSYDGFTGLLSWSGSAFEYFMPSIFMPIYENSLLYESLKFACMMQKKSKTDGMFGRSEGGYYAFDADMNYQYKANGVRSLAVQKIKKSEQVINPYSTFLMLETDQDSMLENLKRMTSKGLYGRYGFYESVDYTKTRIFGEREIVYSYMAHHIGMSLLSCANYLFDGIIRGAFMSDERMRSFSSLLEEKIEFSPRVQSGEIYRRVKHKKKRIKREKIESEREEQDIPLTMMISNGKMRLFASSRGDISLYNGKIALTRPSFDINSLPMMRILARDKDGIVDLTSGKISNQKGNIEYLCGKYTLKFDIMSGKSCMKASVEVKDSEKCEVLFMFEPVMCNEMDYLSHPAYIKLAIESMYDKDEGILYFYRIPKYASDRERWIAVASESNALTSFETRKDDILSCMYGEKDIHELFDASFENTTGTCIEPYCALKAENRKKFTFLISFGHTREEAKENIFAYRNEKKRENLFSSLLRDNISKIRSSTPADEWMRAIYLSGLLYSVNRDRENKMHRMESLWKHGISGDLPIFGIEINDDAFSSKSSMEILASAINVHERLAEEGFRSDLILVFNDNDGYLMPKRRKIFSLCEEKKVSYRIGKKGGIFLLPSEERSLVKNFSDLFVSFGKNVTKEKLYCLVMKKNNLPKRIPAILCRENKKKESGHFEENGYRIIKGKSSFPNSFIYCGRTFGTLVTHNSLGFTYFENAREKRITPHTNDRLDDNNGERILLTLQNNNYDLAYNSKETFFDEGEAVYSGEIGGIKYRLEVGVSPRDCVKLVCLTVKNTGEKERIKIKYDVFPVMGEIKSDNRFVISEERGKTVFFNSASKFTEMTAFLRPSFSELTLEKDESREMIFVLGIFPRGNDRAYQYYKSKYTSAECVRKEFSLYREDNRRMFSPLTLESADREFDRSFNYFFPLQTTRIRIFSRTGFYQSSGAYGFRDQLQDSMGMLNLDPRICMQQICRSASHQYEEGDVMHWWHWPKRGLRTRITDDLFFLPYAVAEYINKTSDYSILDRQIHYLSSPVLSENEHDRYESPPYTDYKGSIYEHCVRAISRSMTTGSHGLPLIGTGDWNDGMDRVGEEGKGESVWLGMFQIYVLRKFIRVCEYMNDSERISQYNERIAALNKSIDENCREKGYYLRAFNDNGNKIGYAENKSCKIDLIPQAFYAINNGINEKSMNCLANVTKYLYDQENGILKLLTPPFSGEERNVGYIASYPQGVRENGGQYTHAAVWGAWGYLSGGEYKKAYKLLKDINPACRCRDEEKKAKYKLEEYMLAGDVYANYDHYGRGGWSLYTGAAGQYIKIVTEELLGYRERKDYFTMHPKMSDDFSYFTLHVNKYDTEYIIKVIKGSENSVIIDGKKSDNKFIFDKNKHFAEITVENS